MVHNKIAQCFSLFPCRKGNRHLYIPLRSALVSEGAYDGNSVYVNYNIGGGSSYLIIGAQVSSMEAGFTHIDTVSFMAKEMESSMYGFMAGKQQYASGNLQC